MKYSTTIEISFNANNGIDADLRVDEMVDLLESQPFVSAVDAEDPWRHEEDGFG